MKATLCICTYNREQVLVNTLKDAMRQDYQDLEILIVDQTQKHTIQTQQYLEKIKLDKRVTYIHSSKPSLTKARNTAAQNATGDVLIYIDDDVELTPSFVHQHMIKHQQGFEVVQGAVLEPSNTDLSGQRAPWIDWKLRFHGSNHCGVEQKTNTVTGCNFSIQRKVYKKVGAFDECFIGSAIMEDSDYGYRCYKANCNMIFSPDAKLIHIADDSGGCDTGGEELRLYMFNPHYTYNQMIFAKKHFGYFIVKLFEYRLKRRLKKQAMKIARLGIHDAHNER